MTLVTWLRSLVHHERFFRDTKSIEILWRLLLAAEYLRGPDNISVSRFLGGLGPRDGEQEPTLFQCFDVVYHATVQDQQLSDCQVDLLIWQMDTNLSQQGMNGDPTFGLVLIHLCVGLHQDQNNAEIWILRERLRAPSCFALPRVLLAELLKFFP